MTQSAPKRRNFLVNSRFQLRFSFYVCSWLIVLSISYPLIITNLFNNLIGYLAADPMGPGLAILEKTHQNILKLLLIMQIVLMSLAFVISVFMAHRIAGPLAKLLKFFNAARDGNIDQVLAFRKSDYFDELVPAYNDMMTAIRARLTTEQEGIDEVIHKIETRLPKVSAETQSELKKILSAMKTIKRN